LDSLTNIKYLLVGLTPDLVRLTGINGCKTWRHAVENINEGEASYVIKKRRRPQKWMEDKPGF
jgi:hypothetical protein